MVCHAAEGISSTSLSDRDQEIRELGQQVQDLTGVLEAISLTQRQLSERETQSDWFSQHWKSWQDGWWHDEEWTKTPAVGSWWDGSKSSWNSWQGLDRWAAPFAYPSRKWDVSESPTFPGFSANYLMWSKAVLRWKMTTDHPVEKTGTKVMNSSDCTVQAFVDGRISTEALLQPDAVESILKVLDANAGWIQQDESKLLLRKALFQRGKRQGRVSATIHDKKVGANRGGLRSCSSHHADDHLGHSAVGRRAVVKAVRTEPQHTLER